MEARRILIANRGEIAIRVMEAAVELGLTTVAIFSEDDAKSLHTIRADEAYQLNGVGLRRLPRQRIESWRSRASITAIAIHPGYGFLSENADLRAAAQTRDSRLSGRAPNCSNCLATKCARDSLRMMRRSGSGRHGEARQPRRSRGRSSCRTARSAIVIKAVAGGAAAAGCAWCRTSRTSKRLLSDASPRRAPRSATATFMSSGCMPAARHIEVQILGDSPGEVTHLWERECTIQRRHQKLVEIAPSPGITPALCARSDRRGDCRIARERALRRLSAPSSFWSMPRRRRRRRVCVYRGESALAGRAYRDRRNHRRRSGQAAARARRGRSTLADRAGAASIRPARAASRSSCGSTPNRWPRTDRAHPRAARSAAFEPPSGPGVRVDTLRPIPATRPTRSFDSLLAKLIVHSPSPGFRRCGHQGLSRACASSGSRASRPTSDFCRRC